MRRNQSLRFKIKTIRDELLKNPEKNTWELDRLEGLLKSYYILKERIDDFEKEIKEKVYNDTRPVTFS